MTNTDATHTTPAGPNDARLCELANEWREVCSKQNDGFDEQYRLLDREASEIGDPVEMLNRVKRAAESGADQETIDRLSAEHGRACERRKAWRKANGLDEAEAKTQKFTDRRNELENAIGNIMPDSARGLEAHLAVIDAQYPSKGEKRNYESALHDPWKYAINDSPEAVVATVIAFARHAAGYTQP